MKTPVIFLIFKRPEETARVFAEIRKARPPRLFIVADGPRNEDERKLTDTSREVVSHIDWPCEVQRDYATTNLGCRRRVWSGLDWAFSKIEEESQGAVILEDDCLPDQTFFAYAEEMLERYKNNPEVLHIGGICFQQDIPGFSPALSTELSTGSINLARSQKSYYFSHISQIWGWATWKRAWQLYDGKLDSWPELKTMGKMHSYFPSRLAYQYWAQMFDRMRNNEMDTWDVAWTYTVFKERGLCIMPTVNLIENIGDRNGATHKASRFTKHKTSPLVFPLLHPAEIKADEKADLFTYATIFGIKPTLVKNFQAWLKDTSPSLFKYIKRFVK